MNRVTDNIDVSVVDRDEGVFEAVNESHDNPDEHRYKVFTNDDSAVHCTCPAFEYGNTDDAGNCKHMRVVEQYARQLHFRDWQQVQKEREEEARKQAMKEAQVDRDDVRDGIVSAIFEAAEETEEEDELSSGARAAQEMLDSAKEMPSKSEWREMSSEGRKRLSAWV